jgi:hypothetical protein
LKKELAAENLMFQAGMRMRVSVSFDLAAITAESLSFIIVQDGNTADSVRFVNTTTVLPEPLGGRSVLTQPLKGHAHAQTASRLAHHKLPGRKALRR